VSLKAFLPTTSKLLKRRKRKEIEVKAKVRLIFLPHVFSLSRDSGALLDVY